MKIIKVHDYQAMSNIASDLVISAIKNKPSLVLGLATGSTPEGLYKNLITNKDISWKNVTTFNLDEYIGLKPDNKMSYHYYMNEKLFKHIDINKTNTFIPSGLGDISKNVTLYDKLIDQRGGIDLQILGIGENAHIAFNEPGANPEAGTSKIKLTSSTINANASYFKNKKTVPTEAISMGIRKILEAKKIILLAAGPKKARAIRDMIKGVVDIKTPASFLQKHQDVTIIVDKAASHLI